jgi:4-hydroxybenzoate polyprenyltransferase
MIMLCVAVGLWIGAFDAVYGAQDENFDRAHGLHSLATKLGVPLALEMARVFHIACIVCFVLTGFMVRATWPYYLGVLIAAVTLVYQHLIIAPYDFSSLTQAYFMRNGVVSVAMFLCTWLSYCVG